MHVLLERHGALPGAVECGLLLAAHACYEAASQADALGVLVQLAGRAMQQWAQSRDWRPLVQLIAGGPLHGAFPPAPSHARRLHGVGSVADENRRAATGAEHAEAVAPDRGELPLGMMRSGGSPGAGMGQYKVLRGGLDMLVANDQLELLLSRRSGARSSSGGVHMASPHTSSNLMQSLLECFHVASRINTLRPLTKAVADGAVMACQGVAEMPVASTATGQ